MGVYEGYQKFRKACGTIRYAELEPDRCAEIKYAPCEIKLDRDHPLEEQAKSLIHEFLHLCSKYFPFLNNCAIHAPYDSLEAVIEKETKDIYANQPHLVYHLRKKVLDLRKTQIREKRDPVRFLRNMHSFEEDRPLLRDSVYKKLSKIREAFQDPALAGCCYILEGHISSLAGRTMHKEDYEFFNAASTSEIEDWIWMKQARERRMLKEQCADVQEESCCDLF